MIQRALLLVSALFRSKRSEPLQKYVVAPRIGTRNVQQNILLRLCLELPPPTSGRSAEINHGDTQTTY
jgi:hypothetical protein